MEKEAEDDNDTKEAPPLPQINTPAEMEAEATLLQVLLDRENFPSGPIDGDKGAAFEQALGHVSAHLSQSNNTDVHGILLLMWVFTVSSPLFH